MKLYYEDPAGITIYHGDCEGQTVVPAADLLVTDPPYGIGEAAGKNKSRGGRPSQHGSFARATPKDYGSDNWDNQPPSKNMIDQLRAVSRYQIIFGGNFFPLPPSPCWLVWDKLNGGNDFADCELAWTNLPGAVRIIRYRWAGCLQQNQAHKERRYHPTQKPVDVMKWAIRKAPPGCKLIFDPFMGSGTTLVAAKQLGLRAVGIEREEKYCRVAVDRLRGTFAVPAMVAGGADIGRVKLF